MKSVVSNLNIKPIGRQYKFWEILVGCIYEACQIDNDEYSADSKNLADAIDTLKKAWKLINQLPKVSFDYAIYRRKLTALGHFAIRKDDYRNAFKVVENLREIGEQSLYELPTPRLSPFEVASDMVELGIAAVETGKDDIEAQIFLSLMEFYHSSEKRGETFLFGVLKLMAVVLEHNRFAIDDLNERVKAIDRGAIKKTLEYGARNFPREVARIKWFLKEIDDFNKANAPNLIQKSGRKFQRKEK